MRGRNPIIFEKRQPLLKHLVPALEAVEKSPTGSKRPALHIWMPSLDPWNEEIDKIPSGRVPDGTWCCNIFWGEDLAIKCLATLMSLFVVCCLLFCFVSAVLFVQFSELTKLLINMLMWCFTMFLLVVVVWIMMNCWMYTMLFFLNACRYRQNCMLISNASPFQKWLYIHQLYIAYTANISQVLLNTYTYCMFFGSSYQMMCSIWK